MRENIDHLEKYRVMNGPMASTQDAERNGMFLIPHRKYTKDRYQVICSDGMGWQHVSVTYYKKSKAPTWDDMCHVKDLFWGPEETVMQIHPAESQYVNEHKFVLHMWKPLDKEIPLPPVILIGAVTAEEA